MPGLSPGLGENPAREPSRWFDTWVQAWWLWLMIAAALVVAEFMSMSLVPVMLAAGAGAAGLGALLGAPLVLQVLIAMVVSLALLLAVRPVAKRHLLPHSTLTGTDALVGQPAIVLSVVDGNDGRIRLNGGEWSARAVDPDRVIEAGATVRVVQIRGATALVR